MCFGGSPKPPSPPKPPPLPIPEKDPPPPPVAPPPPEPVQMAGDEVAQVSYGNQNQKKNRRTNLTVGRQTSTTVNTGAPSNATGVNSP